MCAIAGIVRFDQPAELSRSAVEMMLRRMRHRGPDDSGVLSIPMPRWAMPGSRWWIARAGHSQ